MNDFNCQNLLSIIYYVLSQKPELSTNFERLCHEVQCEAACRGQVWSDLPTAIKRALHAAENRGIVELEFMHNRQVRDVSSTIRVNNFLSQMAELLGNESGLSDIEKALGMPKQKRKKPRALTCRRSAVQPKKQKTNRKKPIKKRLKKR